MSQISPETETLADALDAIFDRIAVSCDWRLSSEERQTIAEAANALRSRVVQRSRDQIYEVVLQELETRHPLPTTVLLATRIANALTSPDTSTVLTSEPTIDGLREQAFKMRPSEQFRLACFIAENVGYYLTPETEHPDSPHASPDTSPDRAGE